MSVTRSLQTHPQNISLPTLERLNIQFKPEAECINELYTPKCTGFLSAQQ